MCELDKKKLGKMIDLVLKGELELEPAAFRTLLIAHENSVNFIEQPVMVSPRTLRPPPAPKPMKITVTIENPDPNVIISIGGQVDMGNCVREIIDNKLFMKMKERAEKTDLKPFEVYDQMKLVRD